MKKTLNVAIIGAGFMGRAHSNAWSQLGKFFDIDYKIVLKVVAGRNEEKLRAFADQWGFEEITTDWHSLLARKDIDVIDILTPTYEHKEMAIAALKAGKHVICEKPCALNYAEAKEMADAEKKASAVTYLNHNYRRVPAVALAKKMIEDGRLGTIYHYRGAYLQEWIMDENFPATWQLRREKAGGGPLFDLSSHAVDLARFLIGEPETVTAVLKTFVKERPVPDERAVVFSSGNQKAVREKMPVTVDDAAFMILEFKNGAIGNIDSSRFAAGRKNYNCFEIYGSKGTLCFNLERMNELEFYDNTLDPQEKGFRNILVTEPVHPYVSAWWPQGHIIGYEHTFVHAFYDFVKAIANGTKVQPDFNDGSKTIRILNAAQKSSEEGRKVRVDEIC
jgi:predicted dehydrogenase